MIKSFRIRLTLSSVLLSGIVLAVFAVSAWTLIYRSKVESLQQEIRDRGFQLLSHSHREGPRFMRDENRRGDFFTREGEGNGAFVLFVRDAEGYELFSSEMWPREISSDIIEEPDRLLLDQEEPPRRADRPHRMPFDDRRPPPHEFPPHEMLPPPVLVGSPDFVNYDTVDGRWMVGVMKSRELTVALGIQKEEINGMMTGITRAMLIALPVGLLLIGIGGWYLAGMATRPVRRLADVAKQVTAHGLDTRISVTGEAEEFKQLIEVFNQMLERLERSFQQALRFSSDAAHELKTPLTILQQQLEQALQRAGNESEEQQTYASLVEEVQRLKSITQKLLILSQADAGELKLNTDSINLSAAVENLAEDIGVLAPHLSVDSSIEPDVIVKGDGDLLNQVLQNLVDNAIKYNVENGRIAFQLKRLQDGVQFRISNSGPSIPQDDSENVFERFYRADKSRSRETQGHGLGLSLAREIARAHGGDIVLAGRDDEMTVFELKLPLNG